MGDILNIDLWGNVTKFKSSDFSVEQLFIGDDIVKYEDSIGNYWDISFGFDNPFPKFIDKSINSPFSDGKIMCHYDIFTNAYNIVTAGIFHMPIVQRVFGQMISSELISVQPMSMPRMNLFHLDYVYGGKISWWQRLKNWWKSYKIMKRYSQKPVNPKFYETININNL